MNGICREMMAAARPVLSIFPKILFRNSQNFTPKFPELIPIILQKKFLLQL